MARVLFVTPAVPAPDRNGLAMRAGVTVDGLSRHHELAVAVVRSPFDLTSFDWVRARAARVADLCIDDDPRRARSWLASARGRSCAVAPLPSLVRFRPPALGDEVVEQLGLGFDVVVVMGTYCAGLAVPFLEAGLPCVLDAFDDDARTCASLAALDPAVAAEVEPYQAFQDTVFPWFERVLFAALDDAVAPFVHVPNAVEVRADVPAPAPATRTAGAQGAVELLFVGNPSYLPNRDARDRLQERIVPAVEARGVPVRLSLPGPTDEVAAAYASADLVVVPLRAGGGTRIKILEAFAHGVPVVATPTGASGLGVVSGEQLVVTASDDDDELVDAIVALAGDPARRARLVAAGDAFVRAHHDRAVVGARLAALVGEAAAGAGV